MTNAAKLKTRTVKELADMARKKKVHGWHEMRKEDLVRALVRKARREAAKRQATTPATLTLGVSKPAARETAGTNGHANGSNGKHGPHFKNGANGSNGAHANGTNGKSAHVKNGSTIELNKSVEAGPKPRTAGRVTFAANQGPSCRGKGLGHSKRFQPRSD